MNFTKKKRVICKTSRKLALRKFFLQLEASARTAFLAAASVSTAYMQQIYGGWCSCSATVALALSSATGGAIMPHQIRPDLFEKPQAPSASSK